MRLFEGARVKLRGGREIGRVLMMFWYDDQAPAEVEVQWDDGGITMHEARDVAGWLKLDELLVYA